MGQYGLKAQKGAVAHPQHQVGEERKESGGQKGRPSRTRARADMPHACVNTVQKILEGVKLLGENEFPGKFSSGCACHTLSSSAGGAGRALGQRGPVQETRTQDQGGGMHTPPGLQALDFSVVGPQLHEPPPPSPQHACPGCCPRGSEASFSKATSVLSTSGLTGRHATLCCWGKVLPLCQSPGRGQTCSSEVRSLQALAHLQSKGSCHLRAQL